MEIQNRNETRDDGSLLIVDLCFMTFSYAATEKS